ncbi:MAG: hypothetical protein ACYCZ8_19000, partial [Acidimicrobiales bacterium]
MTIGRKGNSSGSASFKIPPFRLAPRGVKREFPVGICLLTSRGEVLSQTPSSAEILEGLILAE